MIIQLREKILHVDNQEGVHTSSKNYAFAKQLALIACFILREPDASRTVSVEGHLLYLAFAIERRDK